MTLLAGEASAHLVLQTEMTDQTGTQGAEQLEIEATVTGTSLSTYLVVTCRRGFSASRPTNWIDRPGRHSGC